MIREANNLCKRLWRDESGGVLIMTVIVFLTLFMLACAVYAVGDVVHQKIQLQNAADTIAYSAAVTQADTMSRLAALNRVIAWNYAQLVKAEMDYVVDLWVQRVVEDWDRARNELRQYANGASPGCPRGHDIDLSIILVHRTEKPKSVPIKDFRNKPRLAGMLRPLIDGYKKQIRDVKDAQTTIKQSLLSDIGNTVARIASANLAPGDLYAHIAHDNFFISGTEQLLIKSAIGDAPAADVFGSGYGKWYEHRDGSPNWERRYTANNDLHAQWSGRAWRRRGEECDNFQERNRTWNVFGKDAVSLNDPYCRTEDCMPVRLGISFFEKEGAIIIGVARPYRNPFSAIGSGGMFAAFNLKGGPYIWTVATSHAGKSDTGRPECYNATIDMWEIGGADKPDWQRYGWPWTFEGLNHGQTEWDALLVPVRRAGSKRTAAWVQRDITRPARPSPENGRWEDGGGTAPEILADLWLSREWRRVSDRQPITAGLNSLVTEESSPNYGSADFNRLVLH